MTQTTSPTSTDTATAAGRIPTIHIVADSIPRAHYRAMKAVWEQGLAIRTEYDRVDSAGRYIDPPSRDARVLIEVTDPFTEPRYPPVSFCEIGAYIAEIMGVKDHLVLPIEKLKEAMGGDLSAHQWPYTYHQRLVAHPDLDSSIVDQVEMAIDRVAATPHTRRAVATTSVPNLDCYLVEDVPCLREVQLRCCEDGQGRMKLNVSTHWRSRDLFKAWADNVVALTCYFQTIAQRIGEKMGRQVMLGSYADYSFSLHIYGQDHGQVGGDSERGLKSFFETFDEESYIARALDSSLAKEMLVLPQLQELASDHQIEQWKFPPEAVVMLKSLIENVENGTIAV